jgi:hypothetical protein
LWNRWRRLKGDSGRSRRKKTPTRILWQWRRRHHRRRTLIRRRRMRDGISRQPRCRLLTEGSRRGSGSVRRRWSSGQVRHLLLPLVPELYHQFQRRSWGR